MLNKLKVWLKEYRNETVIFDVVMYGSAARGKSNPQDIDIAVIFRSGTLKERLAKVQEMKRCIPSEISVDMKAVLIDELFKSEFFARSGVLIAGVSVFDGRALAEKMGFVSKSVFIYHLKDKLHREKVRFNYILSGRGKEGMVVKLSGTQLAPGVVQVPIRNADEFEDVLKRNTIKYVRQDVLVVE